MARPTRLSPPQADDGGQAALRFGLQCTAHPAVGGTPLLNLLDALPLNVIYNFETASNDIV